jgi:hypothetical protein
MNLLVASRLAAAAGVVVLASTAAHATMFSWNYVKGQPGLGSQYDRNDTGGTVESINATFDSTSKRMTFDVFFTGATPGSSLITSGFWLVLDNGPNPKTHAGELAILYFDAATLSAPKLSVYGYNGQNASNSWQDGASDQAGNQPGDLIKGIYETSGFINSIIAENTTVGGTAMRHMKFDINAADIVGHTPLYPETGPWQGTGFDNHLGIWFHPVDVFTATYESSSGGKRGKITGLTTQTEGWLDGQNFTSIPTPASVALLGLGGLVAMRRRRA